MKSIYHIDFLEKDLLSERLEKFEYNMLSYGLFQQKGYHGISNDIISHFKIAIVKQGKCSVISQNRKYELEKGSLLFVPPCTLYGAECTGEEQVQFYYIHFDVLPMKAKDEFIQLFHLNSILVIKNVINSDNFYIFDQVLKETENRAMGSYYSIRVMLMRLLLKVLDVYTKKQELPSVYEVCKGPKTELVLACIDYINQHIYENIKVRDLCDYAKVSQSYLYQSFKSVLNLSTKEFLNLYKLKMLECDLRYSSLSIEEIAMKYGYPSIYAFSTSFKSYYNMSPMKFRNDLE